MDMTFLSINRVKMNKKSKISESARSALRGWLKADYVLYDLAQKKFEEKVENYGRERLRDEVDQLKEMNSKLMEECVEGEETYVYLGEELLRYKLRDPKNETCQYLVKGELDFLNELREDQRARAEAILKRL